MVVFNLNSASNSLRQSLGMRAIDEFTKKSLELEVSQDANKSKLKFELIRSDGRESCGRSGCR